MENKPAVEFASQTEEESKGEPTWWVLGGVGLISGGLALVAALPGVWESQIVGSTSRRGRLLSDIFESIGFVPTVSILGAISVICLAIAAVSFAKARRNEGEE
jgi:hypothetical protein